MEEGRRGSRFIVKSGHVLSRTEREEGWRAQGEKKGGGERKSSEALGENWAGEPTRWARLIAFSGMGGSAFFGHEKTDPSPGPGFYSFYRGCSPFKSAEIVLISEYRKGSKWSPCDNNCLHSELPPR